MHEYLVPLRMVYALSPLITVLFLIPCVIYQRHKYGEILLYRAFVMYTFIFYLVLMYFYIITPLPSFTYVLAHPLGARVLLNLFVFLNDIKEQLYWIITGTGTVNISHSAWFQIGGNLGLLFPFGIYMRYYFHRSLRQTVLLSMGLSLFFELTQLTALYGIYPAPYRIFDINDLMFNTIGGALGYHASPWLTRHFRPIT